MPTDRYASVTPAVPDWLYNYCVLRGLRVEAVYIPADESSDAGWRWKVTQQSEGYIGLSQHFFVDRDREDILARLKRNFK